MLLKQAECLAAIGSLEHAVVRSLQFLGNVAPQIVFVFDAKNRFFVVMGVNHSCCLLRLIGIGDRQVEREQGAGSLVALDLNFAPMQMHDPLGEV